METLQRMPFKARKAVFEKLEKIVDIASMSRGERMKYDEAIKVYRDNMAAMEFAKLKGLAEGEAKGRAEGRAEGEKKERLRNAAGMIKNGIPENVISDITGLSIEEIKALKEN